MCWIYVWDMLAICPKICRRYAKDMFKICQRYGQDMTKACQRFVQNMFNICLRYVKTMRYDQDIFWIYSDGKLFLDTTVKHKI